MLRKWKSRVEEIAELRQKTRTLQIWKNGSRKALEQKVASPKERREFGHQYYDAEDLEQILRMVER